MMTTILDTPTHKIEVGGVIQEIVIEKQIQLRDLGELLPDAVLLEIKDIESDKLEPVAKRRAASRIVTRIHSNVTVSETQVADLLSKLVANTALTQNQSDTILTALTA